MRRAIIFLLAFIFLQTAFCQGSLDDLIRRSMLYQAEKLRQKLSAHHKQWHHSYMKPTVARILDTNAVWFDAYPDAMIHERNTTIIEFLSQKKLWQLFKKIGIDAIHTGPMQEAGGYQAGQFTPSVDGGFDPISLHVDKRYGGDGQYMKMSKLAKEFGGIIISDLIPGHTGRGIDFYLALLGYSDYQGLYTIIEIPKKLWQRLPEVKTPWESANLTVEKVEWLSRQKILPGHLQRVMFSSPHKKTTGWDVTGEIKGVDGIKHRYVYLHYFKPGQPTLNWLDASFNAQRLISAQVMHNITLLKAKMMRIDANPFLGLERIEGTTQTHSEGTPLAVNASDIIAQIIRNMGGYSFQELNLSIDKMKLFMKNGADFSYDFITRPALEHAVLTGDARLLNTMLQLMIDNHIDVRRLEHGMQNHDEITYELMEFSDNATQLYQYGKELLTGSAIKKQVLEQMRKKALSKPYNTMSGNGLCTTMAGLVASRLDIDDPYNATDKQVEKIKRGMYLLFAFNALLPGVVNVSGWDLVGALPLKKIEDSPFKFDSDCRWLNRGGYELVSTQNPESALLKAQFLFPTLEQQLEDESSYASKLKRLIHFRKKQHLAKASLLKVFPLDSEVTSFISGYENQKWMFIFNFSTNTKQAPFYRIKNVGASYCFNCEAMIAGSNSANWYIKGLDFTVVQL